MMKLTRPWTGTKIPRLKNYLQAGHRLLVHQALRTNDEFDKL